MQHPPPNKRSLLNSAVFTLISALRSSGVLNIEDASSGGSVNPDIGGIPDEDELEDELEDEPPVRRLFCGGSSSPRAMDGLVRSRKKQKRKFFIFTVRIRECARWRFAFVLRAD